MQNQRLSQLDVNRLLKKVRLRRGKIEKAVENEDLFQDAMEQALIYTGGRIDKQFESIFWYCFRIVKLRLFDKRAGRNVHETVPVDTLNERGELIYEPRSESNNYEDKEVLRMIIKNCPTVWERAKGYTTRELALGAGCSAMTISTLTKKEQARIKKYGIIIKTPSGRERTIHRDHNPDDTKA